MFTENDSLKGIYILPGYKVEPNKTYTLKVTADGEEITGISSSSHIRRLTLFIQDQKEIFRMKH